jgi:hypothetical protein
VEFIEKHLLDPMKWGLVENEDNQIFATPGIGSGFVGSLAHRSRRIFVNSMSDLFHESAPDAWIDRIFTVMALCPQHVFQILTKRPERMQKYLSGENCRYATRRLFDWDVDNCWALPNVWLGVSVENQAAADERIPLLLQTPAAVRFISCEPLLGPVDLEDGRGYLGGHTNPECDCTEDDCSCELGPTLDWVICGGESGLAANAPGLGMQVTGSMRRGQRALLL